MIEFSDILSDIIKADFIKNSTEVAFSTYSGTLTLRQTEAFSQDFKLLSTQPNSQFVFSPNCQSYLVYHTKKCTVDVFSKQGDKIVSIVDMGAGIDNAVWAPDSSQVLTFSNYGIRLTIYNLFNASKSFIKGPKYAHKGFSFSHDGKFMALIERRQTKDHIGLYFTKDWTLVNSFPLDTLDVCDLMWSPNSNFIVAWDSCLNYKLIPICPYMGIIKYIQPYESALGIKTVTYSHNSMLLAVGSFDEKIRLFNGITWQQISEIECKTTIVPRPQMICFKEQDDKDVRNRSIFKQIEAGSFKILTTKWAPANEASIAVPKEGIGLLQFSFNDEFLAFRNDNMPNTLWIYDMHQLDFVSIINFNKPLKTFKWSPTNNNLCIATSTAFVYFWNGNDHLIDSCDLPYEHPMEVQRMKWSQDGKRFLLYDKNSVCMCTFTNNDLN